MYDVKRLGNRVFGFVEGSNEYSVCITFDGDEVKSLECNCFYNANCKHEAALLHYIGEHDYLLGSSTHDELLNRIYSMDAKHLRSILAELLDDEDCKDKVIKHINDNTVDKKEISDKLDSIMAGFDYSDYAIVSDVIDFVDYDLSLLMDAGEYDCAASLFNRIADMYLFGYERINYNSEDILNDRYIRYAAIILEKDCISDDNRKKMTEYFDELYSYR